MKACLFATLLVLCATPLLAQEAVAPAAVQTPPPVGAVQTHTSDIGFSYSLPLDWKIINTKPKFLLLKERATTESKTDSEKKYNSCAEIDLMAQNGNPASVIEVTTLSFACYGEVLKDVDLPVFASARAWSFSESFGISDTALREYKIGTHSVWIERARGISIAHPEVRVTLETVCSFLRKSAVCWRIIAANQASLDTFERGAVTLEGESSLALVPAEARELHPIKIVNVRNKPANNQ